MEKNFNINRRTDIDTLKAIGIICVLFGHFIEPVRDVSKLFDTIFVCIYFFHMPLFCFLSGMVAKFNLNKLITKTVWIYFVSQLFYLFFRIVVLGYTPDVTKIWIDILYPFWHMWYLQALILWTLSIPVVSYLERWINKCFIVGIVLCIGLVCGYRNLPFGLPRVSVFYVYFLVGYLYKSSIIALKLNISYKKVKYVCGLLFGIIAFIVIINNIMGINANLLFNHKSYTAGNYHWYERFLFYIVSFGIVMSLYILVELINSNYLRHLGMCTLPIFIFHAAIFFLLATLGVYKILDNNIMSIIIFIILIVPFNIIILGNKWFVSVMNNLENVFQKHQ